MLLISGSFLRYATENGISDLFSYDGTGIFGDSPFINDVNHNTPLKDAIIIDADEYSEELKKQSSMSLEDSSLLDIKVSKKINKKILKWLKLLTGNMPSEKFTVILGTFSEEIPFEISKKYPTIDIYNWDWDNGEFVYYSNGKIKDIVPSINIF
jgi:hypothetical protein